MSGIINKVLYYSKPNLTVLSVEITYGRRILLGWVFLTDLKHLVLLSKPIYQI